MSEQFQMQVSGPEPGNSASAERERHTRPRQVDLSARRPDAPDQGEQNLGVQGRAVLEQVVERAVLPMLVAMPWMRTAMATARTSKAPMQIPTRSTPIGRLPAETAPAAFVHDTSAPAMSEPKSRAITKRSVSRLVGLSMSPDGLAVAAMVAALHESGATPEAIYTDLLTPAARRLGEMWEQDECTFADVTMGVLRLQNAQRALAPAFLGTTNIGKGAPRVLLMPVPGEQHTFGLTMVADFFTRAGWDAWTGVVATEKMALQMVRNERIDMVGLSFACDDRIDTAARLIAAFRRRAANPGLVVMVGGPSFVADPSLAARVGADATAADGHQAVLRANELLHRNAANRSETPI